MREHVVHRTGHGDQRRAHVAGRQVVVLHHLDARDQAQQLRHDAVHFDQIVEADVPVHQHAQGHRVHEQRGKLVPVGVQQVDQIGGRELDVVGPVDEIVHMRMA